MTAHLSSLELEELAAGAGREAAREHLHACASCAGRVSSLAGENALVRAQPAFARAREQLGREKRARPPRWLLLVPAGALAAAVLLIARPHPQPELRAKGAAAIALFDARGDEALSPRAGAEVELRISPAQHRYALVGALAEGAAAQSAEILWPPGARESGQLDGPRSVRLAVSPGAVRVVALFSEHPLGAGALANPPPDAELRSLQVTPAR